MSAIPVALFLVHQETGQRYPIKAEIIIGQRNGDLVFTKDKALSPRHGRFRITSEGITVEDMNSTLGTRVNGHIIRPQRPHLLTPGDEVTMGDQVLRLESTDRSRAGAVKRSKRPRPRSQVSLPSSNYWPAYLMILVNILMFTYQLLNRQPLLDIPSEKILALGGSSNAFTLDGQWWRIASSMFLHFGILHLLANLFALFIFTEALARATNGRTILIVYLSSGVLAGYAGLAFNPATAVMAGAGGATAGLAGAWLGLGLMGRLRRKHFRFRTLLAFLALTAAPLGLQVAPIDLAGLIGGCCAGFMVMLVLDFFDAEKRVFNQALVLTCLVVVIDATSLTIPLKLVAQSESSAKLQSPYELVTIEMRDVLQKYEDLGQKVQNHKVNESAMAEILRDELIPGFSRVKAKLAVLQPQSEAERQKLNLDQRLVQALFEQVSAMAKYAASKDPKQKEEIEKWTAIIEPLSIERKRLAAASSKNPH